MVRTRSSTKAGSENAKTKMSAKTATPKGVQKKVATKASAAKPTAKKNKKAAKATDVVNTRADGVFENPAVIGNEDLLSGLPSLCMEEVLTLLNQEDVDQLSCASQTLHTAAEYARPRAAKTAAENFSLTQVRTRGRVTMSPSLHFTHSIVNSTGARVCEMKRRLPALRSQVNSTQMKAVIALEDSETAGYRACTMKLKHREAAFPVKFRSDSTIHYPGYRMIYIARSQLSFDRIPPIRNQILAHLIPRLKRFEFDSYSFDSIGINDQFIEFINRIGSRSLKWLRFYHCKFDKSVSHQSKSRFLSVLLTAKPGRIYLDIKNEDATSIFDEGFFQRYTDAAANPSLTVYMKDQNRQYLNLNREHTRHLAQFKNLHAQFLVVKAEHLLEAVLVRLERAEYGYWRILVDKEFTEEHLGSIDSTKYSRSSTRLIEKIGVDFGVEIHYRDETEEDEIESERILVELKFSNEHDRTLSYMSFV